MAVPDVLPAAWLPVLVEGPLPVPIHTELRPVRWDYGERLYALENAAMGGASASPAFGPTVSQADVYWRLYAATGRGCWLETDAATTWRDTALAGSLLAANQLVDETVARAPQIAAIRTAADVVLNPNITIKAPQGRRPEVGHDTTGGNARKLADAAQQEGLQGKEKPDPKVAFGISWATRDADQPPEAPLLTYGAWLSTSNLGVTNLRAEGDFLRGEWSLTGRQKIWQTVSFVGTARSAERSFEPSSWSGGLMWTVPWTTGWTLRADRKQTFDAVPVVTWTVSLRGERRTPAPRGILF